MASGVVYASDPTVNRSNPSAMSGEFVSSQNSRYSSAENPRCHYMMLKLVCGVL